MQFEIYVSTYQNNSSRYFSSCEEESKFPLKQSSFTSLSLSDSSNSMLSNIEEHIVVLYEIKDAGETNVRGEIRKFNERRYAISVDKTTENINEESLKKICDYLRNLKTEDFNKLSKVDIATNIDVLIELDKQNELSKKKNAWFKSNNSWKKFSFYGSLFIIFFVFPAICFCGNYFWGKEKHNDSNRVNKSESELIKKLSFYDNFIDILKNRKIDYEECFEKAVDDSHFLFKDENEKNKYKYCIAYSMLDFMQRVNKSSGNKDEIKANIEIKVDESLLNLILKNKRKNKNNEKAHNEKNIDRESEINKELAKGKDYLKQVEINQDNFESFKNIMVFKGFKYNSFSKNKEGKSFKDIFENTKDYWIYFFIPSVEEMKQLKGITPEYFIISKENNCENWEDFPKVFGYNDEVEINNRKNKWLKKYIENYLQKINELKSN